LNAIEQLDPATGTLRLASTIEDSPNEKPLIQKEQ
jgi:hypothetical protein